jgi:NAD-dependent SIR2 family protein deacetylase
MKTINHAINGLASSLFLSVGLTSAAEKFDPVAQANAKSVVTVQGATAALSCVPCHFTVETGL